MSAAASLESAEVVRFVDPVGESVWGRSSPAMCVERIEDAYGAGWVTGVEQGLGVAVGRPRVLPGELLRDADFRSDTKYGV